METFALKGNILYAPAPDTLCASAHSYLLCTDGTVQGIFRELPSRFQCCAVYDYGDALILPGMTDLHIHAPQFSFRGLGCDLELLEWLNTYTFPEEARYAELDYAERAYGSFVSHLLRSATTRASIFATVHCDATLLLMDKLERSGLITFVGKVNMNRNCPYSLSEISTVRSVRETERWLDTLCGRYQRTFPILTPRFIPSCTDDLLFALARLRQRYALPVQSHLSENLAEIAWIRELCPRSKNYADAYRQFGLLGGDHPCIMAHCVHSDEKEQELLAENGVMIAHCPESNVNLASGVAPVSAYLKKGLRVGLGSDVAGGTTENLFRAMTCAIQSSKLRWRLLDESVAPLTFSQAFYLATKGGGSFFGQVGSFEPGYELDAVVLDDTGLDHPQTLDLRSRLERAAYLADERCIRAKFVAGRKVL